MNRRAPKTLARPRSVTRSGGHPRILNPATGYHYGYPAYGASEPNVVAQWLFDEASGNIVDEVSGTTLVKAGSPTYSVASTGLYAGLSPGITFNGTDSYFEKATATASLHLGTGDFTWECWLKTTSSTNMEMLYCMDDTETHGYEFWLNSGTSVIAMLKAEDGTSVTVSKAGNSLNDGNLHHLRIVGLRSGNLTIYQDGVSLGTGSLATLVGLAINNYRTNIGTYNPGAGYPFAGTMYEQRLSLNATNNSYVLGR